MTCVYACVPAVRAPRRGREHALKVTSSERRQRGPYQMPATRSPDGDGRGLVQQRVLPGESSPYMVTSSLADQEASRSPSSLVTPCKPRYLRGTATFRSLSCALLIDYNLLRLCVHFLFYLDRAAVYNFCLC